MSETFIGFPPSVLVFDGIDVMGEGCRISPSVSVFRPKTTHPDAAIRLGRDVTIFDNVRLLLGDDAASLEVGDRVMINVGSYVSGESGLSIADDVLIGPHVRLLSAGHAIHGHDPVVARNPITRGMIRIGRGAWIGAGATVLEGRSVGDGAVVGAASVVTRDVEPYAVVVGNPARVVGYRDGHGPLLASWRRLLARLR